MNADLARERAAQEVDIRALTHLLDGGPEKTARRRELQAVVENDAVFTNSDNIFMSRPERYRHGLKKAARYTTLKHQMGLSQEDDELFRQAINDNMATAIHPLMFEPNVDALCTDEQRAYWLPRCRSMEVIGCYAQTELGHGSNIRALETTATYIPDSDEFEIHTPTLSATKWWPGTMGRTANHAMVIAQLVIDGKTHGIHNFIVPIRSADTHLPLPGIRAGDIGPKMGFNSMDNGFCAFDRVRVPRSNMAMRYAKVDRRGRYSVSEGSGKVAYLTMMQVRAIIISQAGRTLAKAATIATRYSILRRQGFAAPRGGEGAAAPGAPAELQVLDYSIQMHRLLPLAATAYAFHFTGQSARASLALLEEQQAAGDNPAGLAAAMRQFHAASSGLKSLCSGIAADGIEDCRKACGGHGYLQASGLPDMLGTYLQACTVEGENHMLTQQVTRFLLKELAAARAGKPVGEDCRYLGASSSSSSSSSPSSSGPCPARGPSDLRGASLLEDAFAHRSRRLLGRVNACLAGHAARGCSSDKAWNCALVEIHRASRAHSFVLVFRRFREAVESASAGGGLDGPTLGVLRLLLALFGLYWVERDMGDFTEDGYLSAEQAGWVRDQVVAILLELRPSAVAVVDAWDFSDFQLGSALGRFDGQAYQALFDTTKLNPMNQREPVQGYEESLRGLIHRGRLQREGRGGAVTGQTAYQGPGLNAMATPGPAACGRAKL